MGENSLVKIGKVVLIILIYLLGIYLSFSIVIAVIGTLTDWGASTAFCLGTNIVVFVPILALATFLARVIWRYKKS